MVVENLFLRKQLAFYQERNSKPQRLTDSARFALLFWSRGSALVLVKPQTLIVGHGGLPGILAVDVTRGASEVACKFIEFIVPMKDTWGI